MNKQRSLFDESEKEFRDKNAPLAYRMKPSHLNEIVGQQHLLGTNKVLSNMINNDIVFSMLLWGPPGSGKTSIARIIANTTNSNFVSFSAVVSGIKEVKEVIEKARKDLVYYQKRTILFIDEIHRFNKAQQDAFLPHIEDGTIIFIGATTENPSFQVNTPLLSRIKVFKLNPLSIENLIEICKRALKDSKYGLANFNPAISDELLEIICSQSDGDSRIALNTLELAVISTQPNKDEMRMITKDKLKDIFQHRLLQYDKNDEEHFNLISAFHKSLRGSDPQAAIYWLNRMLEGGEDPLYIIRRMIRCASEDIGLAAPQALNICLSARDTFLFIGFPEGTLAIVQATVYLATAPKSNSLYKAQKQVIKDIKRTGSLPVPMQIRNAPTNLMKDFGYGDGYQYAHDLPDAIDTQDYLPKKLLNSRYYSPTNFGFEAQIKKSMEEHNRKRKNRIKKEHEKK